MSALVGDLIIAARAMVPDPCGTLAAPSGTPTGTPTAGGSLPTGSYYLKVTALTPWGETIASSESLAITVSGGNLSFNAAFSTVPGATGYRAYFGTTSGGQNQYVSGTTSPIAISAQGTAGVVPVRNTAWLPDTDGGFISAYLIYSWLNEALGVAGRISGGVQDFTGCPTSVGLGTYSLTGQWLKFTHAWFDGWPLKLGGQNDIYRRSNVSSTSGTLIISRYNDTHQLELWPQPNRNGNATTITGGISATATSVALTAVTGMLGLGLVKIDNEIMSYDRISGTTLQGLTRGVAGTVAAAHLAGAAATELNLRLAGYRMPEKYTVGSASLNLTVPPAWENILPRYILSKFRETEQDAGGAQQLRQGFEQEMQSLMKATKPVAGPMQIGDNYSNESYKGGLGGGWLIK